MTRKVSTVLALPKYGAKAASMRQRLQQYAPYLQEAGYELEILPLLSNEHIEKINRGSGSSAFDIADAYGRRMAALLRAGKYNAIWLHCEAFPYLPGFAETLVLRSGRPVLLDFDDAIFHQYDDHRSALVRRLLGKKLQPLMRGAAICAPGNAYLADYARRFCPDVRILPTVVDTSVYTPALARAAGAPVTIGWIGTPSTWNFVKPLVPLLQRFAQRPGVSVRIVGAGRLEAPPAGLEFVEWREEREIADIQSMDIGIMPLPDEPWARGKCGYKLIQYGACGLPVVSSPVGVNAEIVRDGETGFNARSPEDFGEALERLIGDAALRARLGAAGRARVEADYSLARHAPRFVRMVDDLTGRVCAE